MVLKAEVKNIYPLSPLQEGILFHSLYERSTAYIEQLEFTFRGNLQLQAFGEALNRLCQRHDIFRTLFVYQDMSKPRQVVLKERRLKLHFEDLEALPGGAAELLIAEYLQADRERGFDLQKEPLLRAAVFKLEPRTWRCLLSFHHIIMDGWCLGIIIQELLKLYDSLEQGVEPTLEPVKPYSSYIQWLGQRDKEAALSYWQKLLEGFEQQTPLPRQAAARSAAADYRQEVYRFSLGETLTAELSSLTRRLKVTLNTIFQTAWGVLLQKYNGTRDVVFGSVVSGRPAGLQGADRMLGLFINTIPVRIKSVSGQAFSALAQEVQRSALESEGFETHPLHEIQSRSALKQGLLQHIIAFENYPLEQAAGLIGGGRYEITDISFNDQTHFDLDIVVIPGADLTVKLSYNANVYEQSWIASVHKHFVHLLRQAVRNPDASLETLELLSEEDRSAVVHGFNATQAPYPGDVLLHQWFERQADRTPEAVALVTDSERLTYRELEEAANRIAWRLKEAKAAPGEYVGVLMERTPLMIAAVLGILKAGAAYVPLDPALPLTRMKAVAAATHMRLLAVDTPHRERVDELQLQQLLLLSQGDSGPAERPPAIGAPDNIAYAIFTSGTTGVPKGVAVAHRPVANLIAWVNGTFGIGPDDRVLFVTSLSFDLSVYDIFGMLAAGGSVRIVASEDVRRPERLMRMLLEEPITLWDSAPAALNQLEPFFRLAEGRTSRLRLAFLSGDWIPLGLPGALRRAFPDVQPIGLGGATEATVWSNYYPIGELETGWVSIPYGRPIANARYYILNADGQPCPVGVPGDLYIGGECLATEYVGDPELTSRRFVADPFSPQPGARMYCTGDRARWLDHSGLMEFLGRADHQVKIRGYRIELGDIQAALLRHPDVKTAAVVVREDGGEKAICAYLIVRRSVPVPELRAFLAGELPGYMIPSNFVEMDALPVTPNGKMDVKALPAPTGRGNQGAAYEAPRNETEEALAAVWAEVLRVEQISIHDNFFSLGGDSIKAIQVMSRLHAKGLKLEMKDFLQQPTIAGLSLYVKKAFGTAEQGAVEGEVALTAVQRWFLETYGREGHFNQAFLLHSRDGFERSAVERTFARLTAHHDALRLVLTGSSEAPALRHRSIEEPSYRLEISDLREAADPAAAVEAEATRLQGLFRLEEGPLVQLGLLQAADGDHLLITVHHLVIDGVSWRILLEDFASCYAQALEGVPELTLPPKSHSFRSWSEALQRYAESAALLQEMGYWRRLEEGAVIPLPKERPQELRSSGLAELELDRETTERLVREAVRVYNADMDVVMLTALGLTVREWAGITELTVQLEGHGREDFGAQLDVTRTIGWFTAMYPVKLTTDRPADLGYQIKSVKEALRQVPNKGIGYGVLRYLTTNATKDGFQPKLRPEISFNYLGDLELELGAGNASIGISPHSPGAMTNPQTARAFVWNINAFIRDGRLRLLLDYDAELFSASTAVRIMESWRAHLQSLAEHCLTAQEKELTPSDLSYKALKLEELAEIEDEVASSLELDDE